MTADVGAVIPVGQTIAWLVGPGEKPPVKPAAAAPAVGARGLSGQERTTTSVAPIAAQRGGAVPQISPKARRLAKELGVEISQIPGTGPDWTITSEDVQRAADSKGASVSVAAAPAGVEALSQVARLMAERTTQSWTSVPHFFLVREVDCSELVAAQKKRSAGAEKAQAAAPTITDLLIRILARVLAKHPLMNASWTSVGIRSNAEINISVAMAVKDGVVAAVIHKANTLRLSEISAQRKELTESARAGRLKPADITGGTFALSNLGMYKVDSFTAIITPPQAAILAVGSISDRVVAVDGMPEVRPMMTMTLSSDHRVVDGARAAEFLSDLANAIREPARWLE
jgi:pyruvate dehydrogenase E2 component (dihydrolipoamide acetyltransferase)